MASELLKELFGGSLENIEAAAAAVRAEAEGPATVAGARLLRTRAQELGHAAQAFASKLTRDEHLLTEEPHTDE